MPLGFADDDIQSPEIVSKNGINSGQIPKKGLENS